MTIDAQQQQIAGESAPARWSDGFWLGFLNRAVDRLQIGRLSLSLPDGSRRELAGETQGPAAELKIRSAGSIRRLLAGGDLGFAEAYMDGEVETDNLAALIELAIRNESHLAAALQGKALVRAWHRLRHLMRPNSKRGSRRNIAEHYDLGNDFYRHWLDETMTYSSGIFEHDAAALGDAQRAKYRRVAELAGLDRGRHVLEIGCGWGGFAELAAGDFECKVTGLTLSREQLAFATERLRKAGLSDRVDLRLQDYRDCQGKFDGIVSIEMFEAVGEAHWRRYFEVLRDRLSKGGLAVLQVITIAEERFAFYRANADFIQRYVFPGGMLPTKSLMRKFAAEAGLTLVSEHAFGLSYAKTLKIWNEAFQQAWPQIRGMGFHDRFKRMWEYYLAYCEAGFRAGTIDVVHFQLQR
jgi:cyclopropane-fatty-acyl-phospholipid synthase